MQLNVQSLCGSMSAASSEANICVGCNQPIKDKYLLKALEQVWHEDCLKCSCCDCRLGEVGASLFVKANLLLCKQDYFRLFGMPGHCSACLQPIPAFEMVMRAREHVYHIECFACQCCKLRFCVGDKFYLFGSQVVCEEHCDYEERNDNSEDIPYNLSMNKDRQYNEQPHLCNRLDDESATEHHNNGLHLCNNVDRTTTNPHSAMDT